MVHEHQFALVTKQVLRALVYALELRVEEEEANIEEDEVACIRYVRVVLSRSLCL